MTTTAIVPRRKRNGPFIGPRPWLSPPKRRGGVAVTTSRHAPRFAPSTASTSGRHPTVSPGERPCRPRVSSSRAAADTKRLPREAPPSPMKSPRLARSLRRWPRFVVSVTGGTESSPLAPADVGRPRAHHDDAHDQELIRKSCIVTFSAWAEPTSRPSTTTVSAMAAPARCHRRVRAGWRAARRAIGSITIVSFLKFVDLQYARVARPVHRQIRRSAIPRWQDPSTSPSRPVRRSGSRRRTSRRAPQQPTTPRHAATPSTAILARAGTTTAACRHHASVSVASTTMPTVPNATSSARPTLPGRRSRNPSADPRSWPAAASRRERRAHDPGRPTVPHWSVVGVAGSLTRRAIHRRVGAPGCGRSRSLRKRTVDAHDELDGERGRSRPAPAP